MATFFPRLLLAMFGANLALGTIALKAAVAPRSPENLMKEASHIVSGAVVDVTSKVQKSTVEKARGIHRDRVYTITVLVNKVTKGAGVKAGEQITVLAWKPTKRIPPLPGPQGHGSIPKKGNMVDLFLTRTKAGVFKPILPNGIVVDQGA